MGLVSELRRRNVFRVAIAYVIIAWVILEAGDVLAPALHLPEWVVSALVFFLILGFPLALIFAWAFEVTPEGIKLEKHVDRSKSITHLTGRKLDYVIIAVLAIGLVLFAFDKWVLEPSRDAEPAQATAETVTEKAIESTGQSIAVLPFVNMSADSENEYFSDGLSEEVLNALTRIPDLKVVARTSAFQFKGQNLDVVDVGRRLRVNHILEGSVRKAGERLRITAQLVETENGFHLWSQTFDRELKDVFAIQDEIAHAIAAALKVSLTGHRPEITSPQINLEAYDLFLKGRFHVAKRGEDLWQGIDLLEQAVALDPDFAEAHAVLAHAHALTPLYAPGSSPIESRDRAMKSAHRALALEPDNASALAALGRAKATFELDFDGARRALEKALDSNPGSADVHNFMGDFYGFMGDFETMLVHEQKAAELDPLSAVHQSDLSYFLGAWGRYEEAIAAAERSLELDPTFILGYRGKILALLFTGRLEEAFETIAVAESLEREKNNLHLQTYRCWANALAGRSHEVTESLKILIDNHAGGQQLSARIAHCYVLLRDFDNAGHWLEQAFVEKDDYLIEVYISRLPEQAPDSMQWQEFWKHPEMAALAESRRSFGMPLGIAAISNTE
jgi:TolB-like protein/Flp pilus assembly protein TadD